MKYLKKKKPMNCFLLAFLDVLLVGVILLVFAFFHHAYPAMVTKYEQAQALVNPSAVGEAPTITIEPIVEVPTEPDGRTAWQIQYEDKFTDEVVRTDHSYTSPEVSITIDTVVTEETGRKVTYYVADIYVASMNNFMTYTAHGEMRYYGMQDGEAMAAEANAILAISGDYYCNQKHGFSMRNGQTYVADMNNNICVLYSDGTMATYQRGSYDIADILAKEPLQVWSFGPVLLDANGKAMESYEVSKGIQGRHPRCAIGYYEPGHYCFVVVDGRQNHSAGMEIAELARVFEKLGCKAAYNLDGGATAVMMFHQKRFSKPSNGGRELGDILMITESGYNKNPNAEEGAK